MDDIKTRDSKTRDSKTRDPKTRDPRGEVQDDDAAIALMDHPDSTEEIPTLDIAPYLEGRPGGREAVAARLREITMTVGFFYLRNHGIPQDLIDGAFEQNRRIHGLPDSEKRKMPWTNRDGSNVGYQGYHEDGDYKPQSNVNIVAHTKPNYYAKFNIIHESPGQPAKNLWPETLPGFQDRLLAYYRAIEKLAMSFLPLWCVSLKLPVDYFDRSFENPHLLLSLLHYPPQKEIGNRQYGIAPHTDNAMMTFLAQADIPGLAVQMPSGHWRAVDIVPGTLLINTGNSLVRWTNEDYLSTKHRVINTKGVDRYSIPVFFGPNNETVVEVLPTCQSPTKPPLYEPISYGDLRGWYYGRDAK